MAGLKIENKITPAPCDEGGGYSMPAPTNCTGEDYRGGKNPVVRFQYSRAGRKVELVRSHPAVSLSRLHGQLHVLRLRVQEQQRGRLPTLCFSPPDNTDKERGGRTGEVLQRINKDLVEDQRV